MKPYYTLLLRFPFLLCRNYIRFATLETWIKNLILLSFALGVGWAEWLFFDRFWEVLGRVPFGYQIMLPNLFAYTGAFLFLFLSYSSLLTSLSSLYKSRDLGLLLASPLRIELVLFFKWWDIGIRSAITLLALMIPLMLSLGMALQMGWMYYILFAVLMFFLSATAVSLGIAIAMVMMLFFPAKRLNQTVAILGLIVAAFLIFGLRFLNLESLWGQNALQNPLVVFLQQKPSGWIQYGPGKLFANALVPVMFDQSGAGKWIASIIALGAGTTGVSLVFGRFIFLRGWWKNQQQEDPTLRRKGNAVARWTEWLPLPVTYRSMLWKDWIVLTRDPSIWTQLLMMLPLAAMYLVNLFFLPDVQGEILPIFAVANVGVIGLIVAAMGARFIFPTASREGLSAWIPFVSPMSARALFVQKALFVLPPVFLVSFLMLWLSCSILSLPIKLSYWSIGYGFFLIVLLGLQALALGAWFPQYRYQNIMEVSLGKGAILFMVLALFQTALLIYLSLRYSFTKNLTGLPLFHTDFMLWAVGSILLTGIIVAGGVQKLSNPNALHG